jgi:hypothetical protein
MEEAEKQSAPFTQNLLVPPEKELTEPTPLSNVSKNMNQPDADSSASGWQVVAKNNRVNRDWEALLSRAPNEARRCYEYLCNTPTQRKQGRVFPLKGKMYKGIWEYEVTSSDRVYYIPDKTNQKVLVYYAGEHPKKTPMP